MEADGIISLLLRSLLPYTEYQNSRSKVSFLNS